MVAESAKQKQVTTPIMKKYVFRLNVIFEQIILSQIRGEFQYPKSYVQTRKAILEINIENL